MNQVFAIPAASYGKFAARSNRYLAVLLLVSNVLCLSFFYSMGGANRIFFKFLIFMPLLTVVALIGQYFVALQIAKVYRLQLVDNGLRVYLERSEIPLWLKILFRLKRRSFEMHNKDCFFRDLESIEVGAKDIVVRYRFPVIDLIIRKIRITRLFDQNEVIESYLKAKYSANLNHKER